MAVSTGALLRISRPNFVCTSQFQLERRRHKIVGGSSHFVQVGPARDVGNTSPPRRPRSRWICGGQPGTGVGFLQNTSDSPANFHFTDSSHSLTASLNNQFCIETPSARVVRRPALLPRGSAHRRWCTPAVAETSHTEESEKLPAEHGEFNITVNLC